MPRDRISSEKVWAQCAANDGGHSWDPYWTQQFPAFAWDEICRFCDCPQLSLLQRVVKQIVHPEEEAHV